MYSLGMFEGTVSEEQLLKCLFLVPLKIVTNVVEVLKAENDVKPFSGDLPLGSSFPALFLII